MKKTLPPFRSRNLIKFPISQNIIMTPHTSYQHTSPDFIWLIHTDFITVKVILTFRYLLLNSVSLSNPFFIILLTFSHILLYFFNSSSFLTKKDVVLTSSKHFTYPVICGSLLYKYVYSSLFFYLINTFKNLFFFFTRKLARYQILSMSTSSLAIIILEKAKFRFLLLALPNFRNSFSSFHINIQKDLFLKRK